MGVNQSWLQFIDTAVAHDRGETLCEPHHIDDHRMSRSQRFNLRSFDSGASLQAAKEQGRSRMWRQGHAIC
jgi:hypothetical protein